ncbi:MAG: hypothetical protein OHK0012_04780 [Synechococcales cyanobacterium]
MQRLWQGWQSWVRRCQGWGWGSRYFGFIGLVLSLGIPLLGCVWLLLPLLPSATLELGAALSLYVSLLVVVWGWAGVSRDPWTWLGFTPGWGWHGWVGWMSGAVGLGLMFVLEGWWGWLTWRSLPLGTWLGTGLYALLLGVAVAWVEELLFRAWLVNELARDLRPLWVTGLSALIFAGLHFLKPLDVIVATWMQFPGLVLMGVILLRARRQVSLGLAIGLHAGWVSAFSTLSILAVVDYTGAVPEWVTGMGGNPLAGVLGFAFLALTGVGLKPLSGWLKESVGIPGEHGQSGRS